MASNVFPMLSSSPPPMDDCPDDDDDDDEFGNFTSANIPFDSSFDSPIAVDKFKPFKSGDNGVNDANFTDEIHKFNSFSNSGTPSPQDLTPNFSDENEPCKNVFKPINNEIHKNSENDLCESPNTNSVYHHEIEVTSHKPVPLNTEHLAHSSDDCKLISSEDCDSHKKTEIKNSVQNNLVQETSENLPSEYNSFHEESSPVCDSSKEEITEDSSHNLCDKNRTDVVCDQPTNFASDTSSDIEFSKNHVEIDRISFNSESGYSDKFTCDFNFENGENNQDDFDDFQQSEKLFPLNDALSSSLKFDTEFPSAVDENNFETVIQTSTENKQIRKSSRDFSDNEFDDFQSCGENFALAQAAESSIKSNDDEYDDFQDFQHSDIPKEPDDFADFQDFSTADASNTQSFDFADFSAVPFDSNKMPDPPESNDFADFEEATFSSPSEISMQASATSQKSSSTISTVINTIFPISDGLHDCDTPDETSPQILEQTNKSRRLWEKLHEVEQTPGLRFQWGVSHSFQQLLRSVNVDYHSILRTSSVPIFASGLSLLEPVKGLSSSVNHESEDRSQIPKNPIPPVEFDWNSSGLVNPLDSGLATSTLMDLSFLSSLETDTNGTSNDHSFENELLKPSPEFICPESSSKTPILEQLLSKNCSSLPNSKLTHRPSDLSDEAVRVLDQLPDLSFMQAKVLMFPISSKT